MDYKLMPSMKAFFECLADTNKVILSEDHNQYLWIDPEEYKNYRIIETGQPIFEAYLKK